MEEHIYNPFPLFDLCVCFVGLIIPDQIWAVPFSVCTVVAEVLGKLGQVGF